MLEYSSKGELVPTKYITNMMKDTLEKNKENIIILDGYPRSLEQAEELEKFAKIDFVINLVTSEETILERLSFRRVCYQCGQIYHLKYFPPKIQDICDNDQSKLIHRTDDMPEVIRERLKIYKSETRPLEEYYKTKGLLKEIDASGKPGDIAKLVENALKS
jgi:adenylate kinase